MARTVTVNLKAEVGQYKRGLGEAERATGKLGDAIDDVDSKGFDVAAGKVRKLGDAIGDTADDAARDLDEMAEHTKRLDQQIQATAGSIKGLAKEWAGTGDKRILASIKEQQRALGELQKMRQLLDEPARQDTGAKAALQKISPQMLSAGALSAAFAPTIGAAAAAAVIGGVGIGGIAGGIALAAKSPLISARAAALGEMISSGLQAEAREAFSQPLLAAMGEAEQIAARAIPKIGAIFDAVAPGLQRLTKSLGEGTDGLLDGLVDAAENSQPVLDALGDLIADTGKSVGELFSGAAGHSKAAAASIEDLNAAVQDLLSVFGGALEALLMVRGAFASVEEWISKTEWLAKVWLGVKNAATTVAAPLLVIGDIIQSIRGDSDDAAGSADNLAGGLDRAAGAADSLYASEESLRAAQEASTLAQTEYTAAMDQINPAASRAKRTIDALKTATDALYGSQIQAMEAAEGYQASWDKLSDSVKDNKRTLDIHTAAGRANRDALQDLLNASQEMYLADINAGVATGQATKKHEARTEAVRQEAKRLGLNKQVTEELIGTYGRIPPKKTTDLVVEGVQRVADRLFELSVMQYALAKGIPIDSARALLNGQNKKGPDKGHNGMGGLAAGGRFNGRLPGAPSDVDNLIGAGPAGQVFGLAGGEYVVNARQTQKHLPLLEAINAGVDGYASGGYFPPVDTSTRWPFAVTAGRAYVMSEAQARRNVVPEGPSGGGATAPWIVATIKQNFPDVDIVSVFRKGAKTLSGNTSYHARNRAVDTEPSEALARFFYDNYKSRLKEQITPWQQYNVHNGRSHQYTGAVWNQHNFAGGNAHNHIAMARGGVIAEPVFGVGASGRTYSFGEVGPERVTPLRGYASGGLVNVAPSTSTKTGTHLDTVEAYISARNAITSLTLSLKENGRTFSMNTQKGRENLSALSSTIRAAQSAAEARYAETGSVREANKVYDQYLKQLDRSLKAMGLNARQRKALIAAYAERPDYGVTAAAPSNSSARVRTVTDYMAAQEAVAATKAAFAWTKPSFSAGTEIGRAELAQLFSYLAAAEQVAQSQYAETGNAAAATKLYNSYLGQLRAILSRSGMSKAQIDKLLKDYGRITLTKNRWGGVHERAGGGLREAQIATGGPTRYAWAEPETGGEAFIPRRGDRARSTAIWQHVGQQWLGQPVGGGRSRPITIEATIPITLGTETITRQVRLEVDTAIGQVAAATIYQTA